MQRREIILTMAMIILLTTMAATLTVLFVLLPEGDRGGQSDELFFWIVGGIMAVVAVLIAAGAFSYRQKNA